MTDQTGHPCPTCGVALTRDGSYGAEVMGDDYYFTYCRCEPCGQWYEESIREIFCGPEVITLKPIAAEERARRLREKP